MQNINKSLKIGLFIIGFSVIGCGSSEFTGANEFGTGTGPKSSLNSPASAAKSQLASNELSGSNPNEGTENKTPGTSPGESESNGKPGTSTTVVEDKGTPGNQLTEMVCPKRPAKGWDTCEQEKKLRTGINKCLTVWGANSPFNASSPYRNLGVSVNILGFGSTIEDTNVTAAPELVVIPVAVNVLTITKYRLLNPNGWYCMIADVGVGAAIGVDLHKTARLADSRVDVRILTAGSNGPATVDVHVLSAVKVRRVD
ncbi:MAG: hypothetical protein FJ146_08525 [Deltaproteobacteria bacterium]|nr:hypothetical protein [Deltaproteobacteria bacterium]